MSSDSLKMNIWTGWPPRPIFSLYGNNGVCLLRRHLAKLDLADTIGPFFHNGINRLLLGIRSESAIRRRWTENKLAQQENNICYDLTHDGFCVKLTRLKGHGLACSEEALWLLKISA